MPLKNKQIRASRKSTLRLRIDALQVRLHQVGGPPMPRRKSTRPHPKPKNPSPPSRSPPRRPRPRQHPTPRRMAEAGGGRTARRAAPAAPADVATLGPSNAARRCGLRRYFRSTGETIRRAARPTARRRCWRKRAGGTVERGEGIWTKQIPQEGEKWRSAADAERLFKQIANEIRADKGTGTRPERGVKRFSASGHAVQEVSFGTSPAGPRVRFRRGGRDAGRDDDRYGGKPPCATRRSSSNSCRRSIRPCTSGCGRAGRCFPA